MRILHVIASLAARYGSPQRHDLSGLENAIVAALTGE
jgi:hypothetical protein